MVVGKLPFTALTDGVTGEDRAAAPGVCNYRLSPEERRDETAKYS